MTTVVEAAPRRRASATRSRGPRLRALRWISWTAVVGTVALAIVAASPELPDALVALRGARPAWIGLAMLGQLATLATLPLAYQAALRMVGGSARYGETLRAAIGAFALSRLLPAGGVAGAVHATRRLVKAGNDAPAATASVTVTGVVTMASLGTIVAAGAALAAAVGQAPPALVWTALAAAALFVAALPVAHAVLRAPTLRRRLLRIAARLPGGTNAAAWQEPVERLAARRVDGWALGRVAGWSAFSWALQIFALWCCFAAVGVQMPLGVLILGFGAANLATALPHTPGGLGVVEAGMTAAYVALGVPTAVAALGVLCYRLLGHWLPVAAAAPAVVRGRRGRP